MSRTVLVHVIIIIMFNSLKTGLIHKEDHSVIIHCILCVNKFDEEKQYNVTTNVTHIPSILRLAVAAALLYCLQWQITSVSYDCTAIAINYIVVSITTTAVHQ